ncbi:MAG: DUF1080 domain-containing protein, partial [Verrucomicrobiales bacterium]|nr:DUF1080 domain-containing protein [Verrucomicrobiales bacterium]
MKRILSAIAIALMIGGAVRAAESTTNAPAKAAAAPGETALFDGRSLQGWKITDFAGKGEVRAEEGLLVLEQGYLTGITYTNALPKGNYELSLEAKRVMGNDFFCGLTFPIAGTNATLILGGWGGGLVGISSIDGLDASENETMKIMSFQRDRWYAVRVRVTADKLEAWLDQEKIVDVATKNRKFSLRSGPIEESVPLGIATYETKAHLRKITL